MICHLADIWTKTVKQHVNNRLARNTILLWHIFFIICKKDLTAVIESLTVVVKVFFVGRHDRIVVTGRCCRAVTSSWCQKPVHCFDSNCTKLQSAFSLFKSLLYFREGGWNGLIAFPFILMAKYDLTCISRHHCMFCTNLKKNILMGQKKRKKRKHFHISPFCIWKATQ